MRVEPAIVQHEFVGLKTEIVKSSNPSYLEISGTIVDETRNTFVIFDKRKKKTVVKNQAIFCFTLPNQIVVEIEGKVLVGRPEDRLKRRIRRLW